MDTNADLKVGDKVKLDPNSRWRDRHCNPINVVGTVLPSVTGTVLVDWGHTDNSYDTEDNDLILQHCDLPDKLLIELPDDCDQAMYDELLEVIKEYYPDIPTEEINMGYILCERVVQIYRSQPDTDKYKVVALAIPSITTYDKRISLR